MQTLTSTYPTQPSANRSNPSMPSVKSSDQRSLPTLSAALTRSLRRPGPRTLRLIDKALALLTPFESPLALTTSAAERQELLDLLRTHRLIFCPYINVDRIESNLRRAI